MENKQINVFQSDKKYNKTRCDFCGKQLKALGAVGHSGHLRWKCRKCGRTVWVRPDYKIPVPIYPVSKLFEVLKRR